MNQDTDGAEAASGGWSAAAAAFDHESHEFALRPVALARLAQAMAENPNATTAEARQLLSDIVDRTRTPRPPWRGLFRRRSDNAGAAVEASVVPISAAVPSTNPVEAEKAKLCHRAITEELDAASTLSEREILAAGERIQSIYQETSHHAQALKLVHRQFSESHSTEENTFGKVVAEQANVLAQFPVAFEEVRTRVEQQQEIANQASQHATRILSLAHAIDQITGTVNILGINALISASQAGEHGVGFSVVARELRKLAARTKVANETIAQMARELGASLPRLKSSNAEIAALCRTKSVELRGAVSDASQQLSATYQDIQSSLLQAMDEATHRSVAISENCNGVLSNLMFQDRLNQHMISAQRISDTWLAPSRSTLEQLPDDIQRLRIGTERLARMRVATPTAATDDNESGDLNFL